MSAAEELDEAKVAFRIRRGEPDDLDCIKGYWLENYRRGSRLASKVPGPIYYRAESKLIDGILTRSHVAIACSTDNDRQVNGFAVAEYLGTIPVLHYVLVKQLFRGFGEAHALLDSLKMRDGFCTHMTKDFEAQAFRRKLLWNPYIIGVNP